VQEIKVRRLVVPNRVHHRFIRAIGHAVAEAGLLAFALIPAGFNAKTQRCKVAITKTNLDPIR
jgi:hypothetical protein